jgi:endonuclease/exonuclease/phosphatase family metal-dependent hydrolase
VKLVTWNVQWCRGTDGRVDPARIVAEARRIAEFDVLCVQEVAANFPDPLLAGNTGQDQFETLAALLPGYTMVSGVAVDHPAGDGSRRRFGNAIFARLPVGQVFRHLLPWPTDPGVPSMPRVAVDAVIDAPFGSLRVITTHLEYYSRSQRTAQVEALRTIFAEGHGRGRARRSACGDEEGPFRMHTEPAATIITGDFNLRADDVLHERMLDPFDDGTSALHDAWRLAHPGVAQPPTFCVHVPFEPGVSPYACDFVFVSDELRARVLDVEIDGATLASDHQPVVLTLG